MKKKSTEPGGQRVSIEQAISRTGYRRWYSDAHDSTPRILTEEVETGVEDEERLPVADGLGHGLHEDRQVAAHVVHDEQEDPHGGGAAVQRRDLHQDGEHDAEPHFG